MRKYAGKVVSVAGETTLSVEYDDGDFDTVDEEDYLEIVKNMRKEITKDLRRKVTAFPRRRAPTLTH